MSVYGMLTAVHAISTITLMTIFTLGIYLRKYYITYVCSGFSARNVNSPKALIAMLLPLFFAW